MSVAILKQLSGSVKIVYDWNECKQGCGYTARAKQDYCCAKCHKTAGKHGKVRHYLRVIKNE